MTHDAKQQENDRCIACIERDLVLEQSDFDRFATLSGDHNPIHVDPDYAAATRFGATVPHGMLLFTAVRGLIADQYPNAGMETQALMFPAPAFAGDPMVIRLSIPAPARDGYLELRTQVIRSDEQLCLDGHCRLKLNLEEDE
ncbi:MaoC family dehydratase [Alloalcanivorax sp. C16-2]|uniref:MaoC family dehydratase n=1 Tax=Alloalcanivorax TaxID=3020832 RepID=UPI0019335883|nr:MaoC/PaaZ C-terminal domain-containing protein [Alloalcanivorax marinus]MBL7249206.1 hypothetical protein [Alloalcanivorax marinus]